VFQSGQRAATADGRWADCLAEQSTREKRRNKELTHHGAKVGGRPRAQKPATGVNANPVAFVERSCIIDGEAVACDDNGIASFELVRHHRANYTCADSRSLLSPALRERRDRGLARRLELFCTAAPERQYLAYLRSGLWDLLANDYAATYLDAAFVAVISARR